MMGKIVRIGIKRHGLSAVMLVMMCAVWVSCGDPVYLGMPYEDVPGTAGNQNPAEPQPLPEKRSLYVTGVEYPEGYNWLPELGGGMVEATLFLMKDGKRIVETKVGTKYLVSADADMHRCVDGHLFTDYSTDYETVIKKDGTELFRYPDREMIHSMLVDGEDVYTLGRPRAGSGFTFRRNGEIVITKGSANILTGLYRDGENMVFAYEDVIKSANDTRYKYYYVVNGEVKALEITDDVVRVNDFKLIDGGLHYIAEFSSPAYRVHYAAGSQYDLRRSGLSTLADFCLVHDGGQVFVKGKYTYGNDTFFWKGSLMEASSSGNMTLAWCADADNVYHLTGSVYMPYISLLLKRGAAGHALPPRYEFLHKDCMDAWDGQCCIAVANPDKGRTPVLWVDEAVTEYDFNGFFTSVSYQ